MTHTRFLTILLFGFASITGAAIALWTSKMQGYVWPLSVVLLVGGLVFTGLLAWGVWRLMSKWAARQMRIRMVRDAFEVQLLWEQSQSLYAPLRRERDER
jgi:hypothetical protein